MISYLMDIYGMLSLIVSLYDKNKCKELGYIDAKLKNKEIYIFTR